MSPGDVSASKQGQELMSASAFTLSRRCSARAVATDPPVECPTTMAQFTPRRSSAAPTRFPCSDIP